MTSDKVSEPALASPRRRNDRRKWGVVGAAVLVVLAGSSWLLWPANKEPKATPSPTSTPLRVPPGPTKAGVAPSGRVISMPVLYPAISAVVPPGLKWDGPGADDLNTKNLNDQLNIWGAFSTSSARALRVEVLRFSSDGDAGGALTSDWAHCDGRNKQPCAGFVPPKGDLTDNALQADVGPAETVAHLGDKAFAASVKQPKFKSAYAMEKVETTYDVGGAVVGCRFHNVMIVVQWRGADYPPGVAGKSELQGTDLPYGKSKQDAVTVVRAIIAQLSNHN